MRKHACQQVVASPPPAAAAASGSGHAREREGRPHWKGRGSHPFRCALLRTTGQCGSLSLPLRSSGAAVDSNAAARRRSREHTACSCVMCVCACVRAPVRVCAAEQLRREGASECVSVRACLRACVRVC